MSREWTKIVLVSENKMSIDYVQQQESSRSRGWEESEECTHSQDCTPPRVRSLRGDGGEKFDTDQKHQPETVYVQAPSSRI